MRFIRKKWLAVTLAAVMTVGTLGSGFALTTVSREQLSDLKVKYVTPLLAEKEDYALSFFVIYNVLKSQVVEEAIVSGFDDAFADSEEHFTNYGFESSADILKVYEAVKAEVPSALDVLENNESNIFSKAYNDEVTDVTYANYKEDLKDLANRIHASFPEKFQDEAELIAPTADDKVELMLAAITGLGEAKIGTANRSTSGISSIDFNLDEVIEAKATILEEINSVSSNEMSESFFDAYLAVADVVLEAVESSLTTNTHKENAILLLDAVDLIYYTDNYDPNSGGSTGGSTGGGGTGGGGGIIAPPVDQPIPTPEKPVGTTNPDATYTSLAMREALQLINSAVVTQTQVDSVLEDLEKEVLAASQDIVETLQVVERAEALVAKLLENESLTDQGAINYANQIMTQFIAPALEKDAVGGTHHELEALAASMIESVLERIGSMDSAAVITDAMVKAAVAEQNNALVMMKEGLSAIFTDAEIAALSQNVSVELDGSSVKLDPAAIAYMKSNDIGIKVMAGNVAMTLPAAMMDTARAGLSLVVELEPKSGSGLGNKLANGVQGTVGAAFDLSVYLVNDQDAVVEVLSNVQPIISLPVGNFRTNLHTVGAYYLNESTGEWEYVRSSVVGDRVIFRAPHLSTYGILQRNVVFADMTNHWAKAVIEELAVKGIVSGRSLTEYEPNGTITRAEFATILVQALQLEGDVKVTFNDVNSSDWYYKYVNVAALHGLVSGVGSGKFDPNANITRQDMAIMIMKAYEKMIGTTVKSVPVGIKDLAEVSAYAKDRVLAARFNKLIGGYPDGSFMPLANATRAEAGQMVGNLLKK